MAGRRGKSPQATRRRAAAAPAAQATSEEGEIINLPRVRLGDEWWLRDPKERMLAPRSLDGRGWYTLYQVVIVAFAIAFLAFVPTPCTATLASYNAVEGFPPLALLVFRVGCACTVACLLVKRLFIEREAEEETVDRRRLRITSHGLYRLAALTQWQFGFCGLYFGLAAIMQHKASRGGPAAAHEASALACVASTTLGVSFSLAMLTTVVVTFVLVPARVKKGMSPAQFFTVDELIMHNANSFALVLDVLLSNQTMSLTDMPYTVLLGCAYVVFHHHVRYRYTRTLLYFFLNWKHKHALKILLALLGAVSAFFAIGVFVSEHLRHATPWGPPLVIAANLAIMRFRPPPPPRTARGA